MIEPDKLEAILADCPFCGKPAYVSEPDAPSLCYEIGCPDNWDFKRGTTGHCNVAPAAIGKSYADAIAAWNRRTASPELIEARGRVAELERKLAAPDWYWPEEDTGEDACRYSAAEVLEDTPPGVVVAVATCVLEVMHCAFLPAADDSDSDDDFWVEEPTKEAAELKIAQERVRRAALNPGKDGEA